MNWDEEVIQDVMHIMDVNRDEAIAILQKEYDESFEEYYRRERDSE
jgi:hypothetical protein